LVGNNGEQIKKKIISILSLHPEGLTLQNLSDMTGVHRQTVIKYAFELKGAGIVHRREVGPVTLYYLEKFVKNFGGRS
jgi:DNA-binding transcriptional ArsR family regulator